MVIIDYIENLQLTDDEESKHFNEIHSLDYLAQGLWFLYDQVHKIEDQVSARLDKSKWFSIDGDAPEMKGIPLGLVACAFHWYAVSVCEYARMVGWLSHNGDEIKATGYVKKILRQEHLWRNKVGAHSALIHHDSDDNDADRAKSVMFPLSFEVDAFFVNSLTLTQSSAGKSSTSHHDMRWSLTNTHRGLIPRYWPSKQAS